MNKIATAKINDYIKLLSSAAPTPGGGTASALCGAQGVALISMVANLTVGKPKFAEHEKLCKNVLTECDSLCYQFIDLMDRDAAAFDGVMAAYKLPRETDDEKKTRSAAIAEATLGATETPFEMMEAALKALMLNKSLLGNSNINAVSDLGVSALCLLSCVKGAWLNVLINLSGIKDAEKAKYFKTKGQEIIDNAQKTADYIFDETVNVM